MLVCGWEEPALPIVRSYEKCLEVFDAGIFDKYGQMGVKALSDATPKLTGLAASSWYYTIERDNKGTKLIFSNSDIEGGCNVAILIQYGHGTKSGGYVEGRDYINPALQPIFEDLKNKLLKEV